jgi:hypothetical protein
MIQESGPSKKRTGKTKKAVTNRRKLCFGKIKSPKGPHDCQACDDVVACARTILSAPVVDIEVGRILVAEFKKLGAKWAR